MIDSKRTQGPSRRVSDKIEEGQRLIAGRHFKKALKLFQTLRSEATNETERSSVSLGYEVCQLHLRLPVEDSDDALQAALSFFRSQGKRDEEAWALICLGIRAQSASDFDLAVTFLSDAARLAKEAGNREAEARALLDLATMLGYRREEGDSERMEQAFDRGYSLALLGDEYEKAVAEATRGIVQYTLGNYSESIAGYRNATELFDSVAMPEQALETSVAYGVALYRTGARKEAEARFKKTVQRGRALKRDTETGVALMYLGQLAENNSKYTLAFQYYEEAETCLGSEVMYRVTLRLGQARALCSLGRYEESARRLENLKGNMSANAALSLMSLQATTLYGIGAYQDAIYKADKAIEAAAARQIPDKEADARAVRMMCYHRLNKDRLAEQDARAIIDNLQSNAAKSVQGRALVLLSSCARGEGNLDAAAQYSSRAVDLLQPLHASLDLAHALTEQGQVLLVHGDQKRAGVALKKACEQAMKVRQSTPEAYRRDFVDSLQEIFSVHIEFLLRKGKVARAYRAALQLLAKSLAEHFRISGNEALPTLDDDTAEFVFLPLKGNSLAIFSRTARNLTGHLLDADELRSAFTGANVAFLPSTRSTRFTREDVKISGLDCVAERKNPVGLRSADGIGRGFSLAIGNNDESNEGSADDRCRSSQSILSDAVGKFREELQDCSDEACTLASSFYALFFGADGHSVNVCKKWIICPSGTLSVFPFEALRDAQGQFVLQEHEILYTKSPLLTVERSIEVSMEHGWSAPVLAVGDPFQNEEYSVVSANQYGAESTAEADSSAVFEDKLRTTLRKSTGMDLPRLPGAAREARSACSISSNNTLLLAGDATKQAFVEALCSRHWDIVHIAVHAFYSEQGDEGALVFFPNGDNILTTKEIENLHFDVDTVVLSACGSALGKMSWTEGSVGFIDAFLRSGSKSVYATLWNIRDDSTAAFMEKVYACTEIERAKGITDRVFDDAFLLSKRKASRGLWGQEFASPGLWASFVHYALRTSEAVS